MTTALALFDLATLNPLCSRCHTRPATTHVYATQNLLGTHPTWLTTRYRDATRRAHSGPCCGTCAWTLATAWWGSMACPRGACGLWAHTLTDPQPGWDCPRHHRETAVVWRSPTAVAA
ncbi:hypothetical protein [Streptomyces sp. SID8352]|uniref:hypothetical protein n=1 Tax=Streptomyces sp. SID8352 TaxID=2690338 RepID=UPI0013703F55|nr:hypothetical protein [Streptomyces sp. SID8352]MYU22911.1 hypothetical protein [Streptomyces sp. SID8352]